MPVLYDSQAIIPAPLISISKQIDRTEDGRVRRRWYAITVHGTLMAWKGSPNSQGVFWDLSGYPPDETLTVNQWLASHRNKMGALQTLFATDGKAFEVVPLDGTASIKCHPRIKTIHFDEGQWAEKLGYQIEMEAENVVFGGIDGGGGSSGVEPEESWSVEVENADARTFRISHTVSSQQRATFDDNGNVAQEGWQNAMTVVATALGSTIPTALLPPIAQSGYLSSNYLRSQTVDEAGGKVSVTEAWVYVPGQRYIEEFTVNTRVQDGRSHVSMEGTITGYAPPDIALSLSDFQSQRFAQATAGYSAVQGSFFSRCQAYSGVTLNPTLLGKSLGENPVRGVITYTQEYDDRPAANFPGSLSEVISVVDHNPADVFARIPILGRATGPILQSIQTVTEAKRSISIEVQMPPDTYTSSAVKPNATALVASLKPTPSAGESVFVESDETSWVSQTGRFSRQTTFVYE